MKLWQIVMVKGAILIGYMALLMSAVMIYAGHYYDALFMFLFSIGFFLFSYYSFNRFYDEETNLMKDRGID